MPRAVTLALFWLVVTASTLFRPQDRPSSPAYAVGAGARKGSEIIAFQGEFQVAGFTLPSDAEG
jgi:hypothetical protein